MSSRICHQDVVKKLLEANVVDFVALGAVIAEIGPTLALADDPWDNICGTGPRSFFRCYRQPSYTDITQAVENLTQAVENLNALRINASAELQSGEYSR